MPVGKEYTITTVIISNLEFCRILGSYIRDVKLKVGLKTSLKSLKNRDYAVMAVCPVKMAVTCDVQL
jgi:hypothetical protein